MKCIKSKSGKTIDRVKDEVARNKVATGSWDYCPKSEWKATRKPTQEVVVGVDEGIAGGDITVETKVHGLKAKDRKKLSKKK